MLMDLIGFALDGLDLILGRKKRHKGKPQIVTFDIDSTLSHTLARADRMINKEDRTKTDWVQYALESTSDPTTSTIHLAHLLNRQGVSIGLVTFRPEKAREITEEWMLKNDVDYEFLRMSEDGCKESTAQYKVRALRELSDKYEILFHVDDYWPIGEAVEKELGIPTIIVSSYGPDAWQE